MEFRSFLFAFLLLCFSHTINAKPVSNEDIKDAILSLVNIVRGLEDKVERHEYRERSLGEQIKKSFISIQKSMKDFGQKVTGLDERLTTLETVWNQKDDREKIQPQPTFEDIQKNLPNLIAEKIKTHLIAEIRNTPPPIENNTKLDEVKNLISNKIDDFGSKIKEVFDSFDEIRMNQNFDKVEKHLKANENVLKKYENKLIQYNNCVEILPKITEVQNDYNRNISQVLDTQKSNVEEILSGVKTLISKMKEIPDKIDIETYQNKTNQQLTSIRSDISINLNSSSNFIHKIDDLKLKISENHSNTEKSFKNISNIILFSNENVAASYNQLKTEVHTLNKFENIMVQTADGVVDTIGRVNDSVYQIQLDFGDFVKTQSKIINNTMNEMFNRFELSVLNEETGVLPNLTTKIVNEVTQVWYQSNVNNRTLKRNQNQSDDYANGTLNIMDNIKEKVDKITDRITKLDSTMNYLLGKVWSVTQDFNIMKKSLEQLLNEMKDLS